MRTRMMMLLVAGLAVTVSLRTFAERPASTPYEDVRQAVAEWMEGMEGKVYKATFKSNDGVSPLPATQINNRLFAFQEGDLYIGIGFSKAPKTNSTLRELQATFAHIALDRIPVPGVEAINWETRLRTLYPHSKKASPSNPGKMVFCV